MKNKETDEYKRVSAVFAKHGLNLADAMFGARGELPTECGESLHKWERVHMPSMTTEERNLHKWHIKKEERLATRANRASSPHFEGLKYSNQLGKVVV